MHQYDHKYGCIISVMKLNIVCVFLFRLAGRRKESDRRDSLPTGDLSTENDEDNRRRPSFLRMVSLSKLRRDSLTNQSSVESEQELVEEEQPVKRREPLSGSLCTCLYFSLELFYPQNHMSKVSMLYP